MRNGDDTATICDFCGASPVVQVRMLGPTKLRFFDGFPADIAADASELLSYARVRQPWYTCGQCESRVQLEDRVGLLQRASDEMVRSDGPNAKIADFPLALMQATFWAMLHRESKFSVLDYVAAPVRTAFKVLAGSERRDFRLPSGNVAIERWLPNETAIHLGLYGASLWLITVRAKQPGHGHGSETMKKLTATADDDNTRIVLRAQVYGPPEWRGPDEQALIRWYARFGFKRFRQPEVDDIGTWMRREPST